jgi:hypothetical protein
MARDYAAVPHEYREEMSDLSDAEFGRLMRFLLDYSRSGTAAALRGNERFCAKRVMAEEDRHRRSYEELAGARAKAGRAGAAARWDGEAARPSPFVEKQAVADDGKEKQTMANDDSAWQNEETDTDTETDTEVDPDTELLRNPEKKEKLFSPPTPSKRAPRKKRQPRGHSPPDRNAWMNDYD